VRALPQDFTFDLLTVKENLNYYKRIYGHGMDVNELVGMVNLEDKANTLYKNLSGGLKKRLSIAITLVNDPDVVFLDEATTGLEPKARRDVWDLIEGLDGLRQRLKRPVQHCDCACGWHSLHNRRFADNKLERRITARVNFKAGMESTGLFLVSKFAGASE